MTQVILQTPIIAQEYLQNHYIYIASANLVFLQSGLQEICCFLEWHPTWQFRNLFLPVLDAIYCTPCAQTQGKPLCKTTSQCTVIHTLHSPTFSWTQITREDRNSEYLSHCEQHCTRIHKFISGPSSLLYVPKAPNSLSLLYQWTVPSSAVKLVTSFPPWKDVRHHSLQEILFC